MIAVRGSLIAVTLAWVACGSASAGVDGVPHPRTEPLALQLTRVMRQGRPAQVRMSVVNCGTEREWFLKPIEAATREYYWIDPKGSLRTGVICRGTVAPSKRKIRLSPGDRWEVPCDGFVQTLEVTIEWAATARVDLDTGRGKVTLTANLPSGEAQAGGCATDGPVQRR